MNYKEIEGYEDYIIFKTGKVFSLKRKRFLKPTIKINKSDGRQDKVLGLSKDGKRKNFLLARLLALHFIPNPLEKKEVDHIDRNPLNNDLSNLRWATRSENNLNINLRKDNKLRLRYISKRCDIGSYRVLIQRLKYNKTYRTKEEALLQRNSFLESIGENYLNIDK